MHQKSRRGELPEMEIDTDSLNELQNLTEMELRKYALPSNYPYELLAFTASSLVLSLRWSLIAMASRICSAPSASASQRPMK
jgi:hypothetical protein